MKEHGIMFKAPMVVAILDGRKVVTRRGSLSWLKVKKGDRLWVRETWAAYTKPNHETGECDEIEIECAPREMPDRYGTTREDVIYAADNKARPDRWRPAVIMPRWASRILLEATEDAALGSIDDVDDEEAQREGFGSAAEFHAAYQEYNKGVDSKPCVVIRFRKVERL